jgi:hypothetical protein
MSRLLSMSRPERIFTGLLVAALAGAGWVYYRAQARQAATLGRITALDSRLAISNTQRAKSAKNTLFFIATTVNKKHNQATDMAVLQQAKEVQSRTQTLLDTLHQLRRSWQAADRTALQQLPAQLNQYIVFIKNFLPDVPTQLSSASWLSDFDSAAAPKPTALALLTRLETQVRQLEAEALTHQAQKIGMGCDLCSDKIGASAIPTSETVAPGAVYQAQLMLLLSASTRQAQFSANGREEPLNPATGQALVQFKVPTARPGQPDTVRAAWHGRVQLPWAVGDTVLETTVPYLIVKPRQR